MITDNPIQILLTLTCVRTTDMYGDLCGVIPEPNSALKPQENADFRQVCLFDLVIPEYPDKTRTHARCMS